FEAFNVGPDDVDRDDSFYRDAPFDFFAPNVWPKETATMRAAVDAYFREAHRVAMTLTDVFAAALGLGDEWFRPHVDRSTVTMRVNHYERRVDDPPPLEAQMRMGAHTDYGVVTVLYADAVPGLQIVGPNGAWHDVVAAPGALLVNLGDLTAQWTNDRWRSTLHRVVPPPVDGSGAAVRRSMAFFLDGNYDALVECLPTCTSAGSPPRYAPVRAGDHLIAKVLGPRTLTASEAMDTAGDRLGVALEAS
ncbi:MAG TPA: 2OG-Fe(II) oxygenase family protein, partial [Ilumatobacteraceae bacterium]